MCRWAEWGAFNLFALIPCAPFFMLFNSSFLFSFFQWKCLITRIIVWVCVCVFVGERGGGAGRRDGINCWVPNNISHLDYPQQSLGTSHLHVPGTVWWQAGSIMYHSQWDGVSKTRLRSVKVVCFNHWPGHWNKETGLTCWSRLCKRCPCRVRHFTLAIPLSTHVYY